MTRPDPAHRVPAAFPGPAPAARLVTVLAALVLAAGPLCAQEREPAGTIRSDRPGLGDGAWVLPSGVRQVELGGTLEGLDGGEHVAGSGLVRLGFGSWELRLFAPPLLLARGEDDVALGDLAVGAKLPVAEREAWSWALTGALTLPTSTLEGASDDPAASVAAVAETALSPGVGLAVNVGYGFPFDAVDDGTLSLLVTPVFDLGGGTGVYAGYAGFLESGPDTHYLEAGLSRVMDDDTQWDLNAAYDVEGETWFVGVGLARRWR